MFSTTKYVARPSAATKILSRAHSLRSFKTQRRKEKHHENRFDVVYLCALGAFARDNLTFGLLWYYEYNESKIEHKKRRFDLL